MSVTNYNWTSAHPRHVVDLNKSGTADLIGFGADGVWTCLQHTPQIVASPDRTPDRTGSSPGRRNRRRFPNDDNVFHPSGIAFAEPVFACVGFEANAQWRVGDHPRLVADLTGDRNPDIVGFGNAGVWTSLGDGRGGFAAPKFVLAELGFERGWTADYPRFAADLTGDGKADVVGFGHDGIWTAVSRGDGSFNPAALVSADLAFNSGWRVERHPRFVVDLTGDGRADILGFGDQGAWIARGRGDGTFEPAQFVLADLGYDMGWRVDRHERMLADLTGDGRPDVIAFGDAGVWTALANGDGTFQAPRFVLANFGADDGWLSTLHPRFVVDLTGDGRADVVAFGNDGVWVALGNGDGTFQPARMVISDFGVNQGWQLGDHPRVMADIDGDGRADIVGFGDAGVIVARGHGDGTFDAPKLALADFGRQSNVDTVVRREIVRDHRQHDRIKKIFVLMLENRSYDHMLGFADLHGIDAATGGATTADGLTGRSKPYFNTYEGRIFPVQRGAPDITAAPGHDFVDALAQLCGPYAKDPNGGPYPDISSTGFVYSLASNGYAENPGEVMRCFTPDQVPILTQLAREFAVCDRWFSSMPGPTEPNRYFMHAATSGKFDDSPEPHEIIEASTNHWGGMEFDGGNLFDSLRKADVKFKIYAGDNFPVCGELDGVSNTFDVHDFDNLRDDLLDPNFDAQFIHIEPKYFDGTDVIHTDFSNGNSQHPKGGVAAGERLIKATYEAIRQSPHWNSSMLIVTYDEHGGFYDHVTPGPAAPTGSKGRKHGFMFDRLGARVPAIVISPLVPRGLIEHRLLEHCSIIQTVCDLFSVSPIQHARDLSTICGLLHLAQLEQPRDTPERLDDVVVSSATAAPRPQPSSVSRPNVPIELRAAAVGSAPVDAAPLGNPPDSFIAMTVRVAAVRDVALDPANKQAVAGRVAAIDTVEEAAAYVAEVNAKIENARLVRPPMPVQ